MSKLLRKHQLELAALTAALAAIILYWPSLKLPFIYDSLLHARIAKGLNLFTVWLPTDRFGFYRPLIFFPMLIIRGLFGHYPPRLLHSLNVVQHALNAALLVALSWRLWRNWPRALAAGLLLALFPFTYQVVAVFGHNVHITTAGLTLLALHSYLSAIQHKQACWWLLTGLLFLLGLLNHETAILFGPFAALLHWNHKPPAQGASNFQHPTSNIQHPIPGRLPPWLLFSILGGLYVLLYQFLPIAPPPQEVRGGGGLPLKILYLLQAAAHPFTWFAHRLPDLKAATIVGGGTALTLGLTLWSARQRRNRLPLLLGWGWWGLTSAILVITLPANYLLHGPRLLYLGSLGLALLWPLLLEPLRRIPQVGRPMWTAALGFILITGWSFVRHRLEQYTQLAGPVALMEQVMAGRPAGEGILLVNLPAWLSPPRNTYPVGAEHVAMMGHYLFLEELAAENLHPARPARAIVLPELLGKPDYNYSVFGEKELNQPIPGDWAPAGSQVIIVHYAADGLQSRHMGQISPTTAPVTPPVAQFGPYQLLAAEVSVRPEAIHLTTRWRWAEKQAPPATASLFVQLLDESGQLIAQADGPPLGMRPDLIELPPHWELVDRRTLTPLGRPGSAQLLLGAYNYLDGQRFPALDSRGHSLPDNALRIPY